MSTAGHELATSVVVCTRDRPALVRALVRALDAQSRRPDEIVVVDGSSSWELEKDLQRADVKYVRDEGGAGLAAARNLGARAATKPLVIYLDDDIAPPADLVERLARAHAEHPEAAAIGGVPVEPHAPSRLRVFFLRVFQRGPFFHPIGVVQRRGRPGAIRVQRLSTAVFSARREVLLANPFDEDLVGPSVGEDADLSVRLDEQAPVLLLSDLRARHEGLGWGSRSLASRFERKVYSYAFLYYKDLRGKRGMRARFAWLLVGIGAEALLSGAHRRTLEPLRGVARAFRQMRTRGLDGAGGFIRRDPRRRA
jgi:GT2 family glycosyltransferase